MSVICNCAREARLDGVLYRPLDSVSGIHADVLVMHSSGGGIDLTPLLAVEIEARVRILLLSGLEVPKRAHDLNPDATYVCSNFIRTEMTRSGAFTRNLFVTHYGVNRWNWTGWLGPRRNAHRLIHSSHPSKGFDAALEVARRLHRKDSRFRLHYFGGSKLWGEGLKEEVQPEEPCIVYGGLINQRDLAAEYKKSAFLVQLQTRREPFGIIVVEAMAAGCVVVASPVGAFPELIEHGENGFLVEGDPGARDTVDRAAELIGEVNGNRARMEKIRARARRKPFDWATIAAVWESHLQWLMGARDRESGQCSECGGKCLSLSDGVHCTDCGWYGRVNS